MQPVKEMHALLESAAQYAIGALLQDCKTVGADMQGRMRQAIDSMLAAGKESCTKLAEHHDDTSRKKLHDRDVMWQLKLETSRASVAGQLRNQKVELEDKHEKQQLAAIQSMQSGNDNGLRDALEKLQERKEEIAQLEKQIKALQKELAASKSAVSEAHTLVKQIEQKKEQVEAEAQDAFNVRDKLEADAAEAVAREAHARVELESSEAKAAALEQKGSALGALLNGMRAERDKLASEREEVEKVLRAESVAIKAERDEAQVALRAELDREGDVKVERDEAVKALAAATKAMSTAEASRDAAIADAKQLEDELAKCKATMRRTTDELQTTQAKSQAVDEELDAEQQKVRELEEELENANDRLSLFSGKQDSDLPNRLKSRMKDLEHRLERLREASKIEREQLIDYTLKALGNLRQYFVSMLTGGPNPSVLLVNGPTNPAAARAQKRRVSLKSSASLPVIIRPDGAKQGTVSSQLRNSRLQHADLEQLMQQGPRLPAIPVPAGAAPSRVSVV